MVDDNKPKTDKQNGPLRGVDPKVEAKVDRMMMPESNKSQTAPLLPGEKLPDFNKKDPKPEIPSASASITKSPSSTGDNPAEDNPALPESPANKALDDPATAHAVDEIVEEESDRMLAIEDAKAQLLAEGVAEIDRGFFARIKGVFGGLWRNVWARTIILLAVLAAVAAIAVVPSTRYFVLNVFGVRASISLRIIDDKTGQPLKNVEVSVDDVSAQTDKSGNVKLEQLQLGKQQLSVKKPAFAETYRQVTVGWGSNPIGDIGLIPVGSRYKFIVKDFVSGKPIVSAEAISGDASATANKKGEIVLVVADQNESEVNIKINAAGYRSEKIKLEVGSKGLHRINLAPAKKHAFVSKRSGKYDLYKIDIDGKNEEMILAGTGSESESTTVILPNKDNNLIAFVSTRGDQRDQDGYALSNLMIIDLTTGSVETIDHSQRLQLLSFAANELVYVRIAEGEEDDSPKRHQLISYDTDTKQQNTLAQANYFNDALVADGAIYYAPAKFGKNTKAGLFKVNPDGSNKTTVYDKETWSLFRVAYDKLNTAVGQDWFEYNLFSGTFNPLSGAPPDQQSRIYVADPLGDKSAWVDSRDGKGVLIVYDTASGQDTVIQTQGGLSNPISWLDNDHLVYRVTNSSETADYVISLSGGDPKKIRDVTNTAGLDRWYYY